MERMLSALFLIGHLSTTQSAAPPQILFHASAAYILTSVGRETIGLDRDRQREAKYGEPFGEPERSCASRATANLPGVAPTGELPLCRRRRNPVRRFCAIRVTLGTVGALGSASLLRLTRENEICRGIWPGVD
jgi:hypothetical protein